MQAPKQEYGARRRIRRFFSRIIRFTLIPVLVWLFRFWRWTCRIEIEEDDRPGLRAKNRPYVLSILHSHLIGALMVADEPMAAMVSRSSDGDWVAPILQARNIIPVRGSSHKGSKNKGGATAYRTLQDTLQRGVPPVFVVDGPRGPKYKVHPGAARMARRENCAMVACSIKAGRFWTLSKAWDQNEIPKPFTKLRVAFRLVEPTPTESEEALRQRIGETLWRGDTDARDHAASEYPAFI